MRIENVPFQTIDWATIPATSHRGETGEATWQTVELGDLRVRMVRYSAGYLADHWCERGHAIHVLDGHLTTELRDGRTFETPAGASYIVATGDGAHRSRTQLGAVLFIVD
jgi:quercetin dioxygenase-like cupin family protein